MDYSGIKLEVKDLADGRTFNEAQSNRWIKLIREDVSMDPVIAGFTGIYFLYKEATVSGGSVATQGDYAVPDDFICDLNVFYGGLPLMKSVPGILDITVSRDSSDDPIWFEMAGTEFRLKPIPDTAGDEIKLFYNGLPDEITSDSIEDYFMKRFANLHIFGMASRANWYLGDLKKGDHFFGLYEKEKQKLMLHNRSWHVKNARMRVQNWDEFQEQKTMLFPQFTTA